MNGNLNWWAERSHSRLDRFRSLQAKRAAPQALLSRGGRKAEKLHYYASFLRVYGQRTEIQAFFWGGGFLYGVVKNVTKVSYREEFIYEAALEGYKKIFNNARS